jgi:hypothetical protein
MEPENSSQNKWTDDIGLALALIGLAVVGNWLINLLNWLGPVVLTGLQVAFSLLLVFVFFTNRGRNA